VSACGETLGGCEDEDDQDQDEVPCGEAPLISASKSSIWVLSEVLAGDIVDVDA